MSEDLHALLADMKGDLDAVKLKVGLQAAELASVKESMTAAHAAGTAPTAEDLAMIDAIHAELHEILGKAAPTDNTEPPPAAA